jgi:subtilase family serine protease
MTLRFNGTVVQVESAFHTEIHNLNIRGEKHIANVIDPQIPAALAPVVVGVKSLHNFFPRTMRRNWQPGEVEPGDGPVGAHPERPRL